MGGPKGRRAGFGVDAQLVLGVRPKAMTPAEVTREFRGLLAAGHELAPGGDAAEHPEWLLRPAYLPKHRIDLFDATYYLADQRECPEFRFLLGYVVLHEDRSRKLVPRIFYKDSSLIWRVVSHLVRTEHENWMGKGDLKWVHVDGELVQCSAEETTNLPLEVQNAFDLVSREAKRTPKDLRACELVLRRGNEDRIQPFADFTGPRRRAFADPRRRIHGGRSIASFSRPGDPSSLHFVRGFEPDLRHGVVEIDHLRSHLYAGDMRRVRVLSTNRLVQYQILAGPHHTWVIPPQPLSRELSPFGVRTLDAVVHDDLCVPGYEYHFVDDSVDPPALHSQIPAGYAGAESPTDPGRADASPWLDRLPIVKEFRRAGIRRTNFV